MSEEKANTTSNSQIILKAVGIGVLIALLVYVYIYFVVDSSHDIHDMSQGKIELSQPSAMAGEWFYFTVKIDGTFDVVTYPKVDSIVINGKVVRVKMPNVSIKVNVIPTDVKTLQGITCKNGVQCNITKAETKQEVSFSIANEDTVACIKINDKIFDKGVRSFTMPDKDVAIEAVYWIRSNEWPYGKWYGDVKNGKPNGRKVTVIYDTEILYNEEDPLKRYAKCGQKVVGIYIEGNLIEGDLYDPNNPDKMIKSNFSPKSY